MVLNEAAAECRKKDERYREVAKAFPHHKRQTAHGCQKNGQAYTTEHAAIGEGLEVNIVSVILSL